MIRAALAALTLMTAPAFADFTENNLLAIFYHELGHAVIDQMQAPNFGQSITMCAELQSWLDGISKQLSNF